jgi:XrtJ-associated TM-motif-TM protein
LGVTWKAVVEDVKLFLYWNCTSSLTARFAVKYGWVIWKREVIMKLKIVFMTAAFCVMAAAAHAQGGTVSSGCGASPENPTAILALVGSAGGFLVAARNRFLRK